MITRHFPTKIMHRAVDCGGMIFMGGITADDLSQDIKGQTQQIFDKLKAMLAEIGSDLSHLVSATVYLTDMGMKNDMNAVWTSNIAPDLLPSRATIGVADLGSSTLIEVSFVCTKA